MTSPKKRVVVVGMGMAGCMAAYGAHAAGHEVTLLGTGAGSLSIGGGCVDVLGYVRTADGVRPVRGNPFDSISLLPTLSPAAHPYALLGAKAVHKGLRAFHALMKKQGLVLQSSGAAEGEYAENSENTIVATIMGTLKPTYLCAPSHDVRRALVKGANTRIAVVSVDAIRDCHPILVAQELQQRALFKEARFTTATLSWSKGKARRPLSPLDVARFVDTEEGRAWLVAQLLLISQDVDAFLMPPILGVRASAWDDVQTRLQRPIVEMVAMPPGVGGLRIFTAFMRALRNMGVNVVENATVTHAECEGTRCTALLAKGEGAVRRHAGDAFVIATGGVLGGGIVTRPGSAQEAIFGLPVEAPVNPEEWSLQELFAEHPFASMGVRVNERFLALDAFGAPMFSNVHFAGRILGAYDYVTEKSGNGVAATTGWHVGNQLVGGELC